MFETAESAAIQAMDDFEIDYAKDAQWLSYLADIRDYFQRGNIFMMRYVFEKHYPAAMTFSDYFYFHLILNELEELYG